ncbi:MAG: FKBP-type peptidyl-prolyl cis-trans isomerase N-terminal domain-containing protein [Parachlamydiales bacterium]|jgi:peptidylprolyl isomerase
MLRKTIAFFIILITFSAIYADETKEVDTKKLSEAIGHIIGKNLEDLGFELDLKRIITGIKKGSHNKTSPMTEDECLQALAKLQVIANEKICQKNLKIAEEYLAKNINDKNVIEIEKGKLQYKILNEGKDESVQSYNSPTIKIVGKYLDGKIFTDVEEIINLTETIPALKRSIIGMKKNERRQVYIHPDLGFGKIPPCLNSLIVFDIEIVKVDTNTPLSTEEIANKEKVF